MSKGVVISLCDYTTNMVRPWADAGYECHCYDLQHPAHRTRDGHIWKHRLDLRSLSSWEFPGSDIEIVFGFPPCTDLASSGARWFAEKGLQTLINALQLVENCRRIAEMSCAPWMLENPVGRLSTCWRQPDYTFDPFEYAGYPGGEGDTYTKKTCLWTGNGFVMPEPRPIVSAPLFGVNVVIDDRIHQMPPSDDRANLRSVTPMGFARAVFEANSRIQAAEEGRNGRTNAQEV